MSAMKHDFEAAISRDYHTLNDWFWECVRNKKDVGSVMDVSLPPNFWSALGRMLDTVAQLYGLPPSPPQGDNHDIRK